jgi:hypothetical protein
MELQNTTVIQTMIFIQQAHSILCPEIPSHNIFVDQVIRLLKCDIHICLNQLWHPFFENE